MLALISAPSNLGLRPPQPGSVPGTAKAPEALREAGLHARLAAAGAVDAGVVLPGRYADDVQPGVPRTRNQDALLGHARRLAARIDQQLGQGRTPLVLGGDCSLLIAAGQALAWPARTWPPPSACTGPLSPAPTAATSGAVLRTVAASDLDTGQALVR